MFNRKTYEKEWRKNNRESVNRTARKHYEANKKYYQRKVRDWKTRTQYGIDLETYEQRIILQGNYCEICLLPCTVDSKLLIDHNHISKKFRGLLCRKCNTALGHFNDDPSNLHRAINYLMENR